MRRCVGPLAAVLLSSVLFGLGHAYQGIVGILRTAIIGLAFGAGCALTKSLWWLVVAHVIVSLCAVAFARRLSQAG